MIHVQQAWTGHPGVLGAPCLRRVAASRGSKGEASLVFWTPRPLHRMARRGMGGTGAMGRGRAASDGATPAPDSQRRAAKQDMREQGVLAPFPSASRSACPSPPSDPFPVLIISFDLSSQRACSP